ncbi:MAG TPA: MerR family transcriptional regulator, partial [Synergistaceae bacterium]|nr:MerR family transcriptional regulator [Synergistaceae bacterium]
MAQEWLSLAEISRRTGIAESSLRRYARNFAPHLLQEQSGKRWVFAEESVEVFDRIGTAYREGKTTEEVARMLETTP